MSLEHKRSNIGTASSESRTRVVLEKLNSLNDSERSVLNPLFSKDSLDIGRLKYYLSHCDWKGLQNWVRNTTDTNHVKSVCSRNLVTSLLSDILVTGLCKRGFFLLPRDNTNAARLLQRLCVSEQLFSRESFSSTFHNFFVAFCIEQEFFSVLRDYTWIHRLDLSSTNVKKPWATLLLAGRNLDLFEASMSNAIFCGYPDNVSDMMSNGHVTLALGTLMYGGNIMKQENYLKRWPSLLQALYGPSKPVVKDVKSFFQTFKQDVDLFTLLSDTSPFKLSIVRGVFVLTL